MYISVILSRDSDLKSRAARILTANQLTPVVLCVSIDEAEVFCASQGLYPFFIIDPCGLDGKELKEFLSVLSYLEKMFLVVSSNEGYAFTYGVNHHAHPQLFSKVIESVQVFVDYSTAE